MRTLNTYRICFHVAAALFIAVALASFGFAQQYVSKAPTAADWTALGKLPDFNGVWERGGVGAGGNTNSAFGPQPARGGAAPAAAPPQRGAAPDGGQRRGGAAAGGGAAGGARGGGRGGAAGPVFAPQYEAMRQAAARAAQPEDNSTANCLPPGMPGIMGQPYPMEFLLTPGKVTIVIEAYTQVRHIYTDGRPLPEDPDQKFFGTSIGHWENGTLVAETVGFSPQTELAPGTPHGGKMRIVERFRLTDPDTMSIETTITDPEALTAPYT